MLKDVHLFYRKLFDKLWYKDLFELFIKLIPSERILE